MLPVPSGVRVWLVGFALLLALPAYLPLPDATLAALEPWYAYFAAVVPLVLAWPLRKIIPRLMKWIFFAALAAFVIALIVAVATSR